jgi:predicted Ser/Thr protein kinase
MSSSTFPVAKKKKIKLTRRKLERLSSESIHNSRNWSKAQVSITEWPQGSGNRVVIKDLRRCPLWFRWIAGRYQLSREWRALTALRDLDGVPKVVARPSADVLVMEFKEGRPLEEFNKWELPEEAAPRIEKLVHEMHARGVTHGDLHGLNILIDEDANVALIDWATSGVFGPKPSGPKKFTFEEWKALDERALAKVKVMHDPLHITERERDLLLNGGSRIYRFFKSFRRGLEKMRGVDQARLELRAAKQAEYLERLDVYYGADEETRQRFEQKRRAKLEARTGQEPGESTPATDEND